MTKGRMYWNISKGEQIGFTIIAIFVLLIILARLLVPYIPTENDLVDRVYFDSLKTILLENDKKKPDLASINESFSFDANRISVDSLMLFGLSPKQANTFIHYREAIGGFSKPDQFLNLYGYGEELKQDLIQYAFIAKIATKKTDLFSPNESELLVEKDLEAKPKLPSGSIKENIFSLELNSATEEQLQMISGIGPSLSKRIVKYRNGLGGFIAVGQLYEVYGVDSTKLHFNKIKISLDTSLVQKIAINTVTAVDLASHPYFWGKKAYIIVNYRNEHGAYKKPRDLLNTKVISEKELKQMVGYIQFE